MVLRALRLVKRDPGRAFLLARMAGWVVVLSALARFLSLPRALRFVSTGLRPQNRKQLDRDQLATAIDALLELEFLVFKPSCWKRATVLHRYFALAGVPTSIRFGVRKDDGELKGHAWLEMNGEPILESSPPNYNVTYTFPSAQHFDMDLATIAKAKNGVADNTSRQ